MDPKLLTCAYSGSALVTYNEGTSVEFLACHCEQCVEPCYEEVPTDPTDRAAYYARRDEADYQQRLVEMDERQWSLLDTIRPTFAHDHGYGMWA